MRLTPEQVQEITAVAKATLLSVQGELLLYGSRSADLKKGGDIDLVFVTSDAVGRDQAKNHKLDFLTEIKKRLGERKIDISIIDSSQKNDPFWMMALKSAISLWHS